MNRHIKEIYLNEVIGRIKSAVGVFVRASLPVGKIGDLCYINTSRGEIPARVVAIDSGELILMPYDEIHGIGIDSRVLLSRTEDGVEICSEILGRVIDGFGNPVDGQGALRGERIRVNLNARPPSPLKRKKISSIMQVGVKVIDALLTVGEGQRIGIFAGAGVGKSTLLGMICRNAMADVNVIALVGERGREVREFVEDTLGEAGLKKSVIVVATSDESPLMKLNCAYLATAIAEYFRDTGAKVILMMDSVTRFARAQRDAGLASGEPPARQGFPPSVFAVLPKLLERSGNGERGSITAFYTVLMEGDDATEPVSDEVKSILDGHIILSRDIAGRGIYPAIDLLHSVSRVMPIIVSKEHLTMAGKLRELLASYESKRDLLSVGMYKGGDRSLDFVIENYERIVNFLKQDRDEKVSFENTILSLQELLRGFED